MKRTTTSERLREYMEKFNVKQADIKLLCITAVFFKLIYFKFQKVL